MRFRIALALVIGAAAFAASGRAGVTNLGRRASCEAASLAERVQNLSGFELLFGTVLTRVDPGLRRSALLALGPTTCHSTPISRRAAGYTAPTCEIRPVSLRGPKRTRTRPPGSSLAQV